MLSWVINQTFLKQTTAATEEEDTAATIPATETAAKVRIVAGVGLTQVIVPPSLATLAIAMILNSGETVYRGVLVPETLVQSDRDFKEQIHCSRQFLASKPCLRYPYSLASKYINELWARCH